RDLVPLLRHRWDYQKQAANKSCREIENVPHCYSLWVALGQHPLGHYTSPLSPRRGPLAIKIRAWVGATRSRGIVQNRTVARPERFESGTGMVPLRHESATRRL